jgi:hypothetical protein
MPKLRFVFPSVKAISASVSLTRQADIELAPGTMGDFSHQSKDVEGGFMEFAKSSRPNYVERTRRACF